MRAPPGDGARPGRSVVTHDGWDTIYAAAAEGLDVLDNFAAAWANDFIARTSR